VNPHAASKSAWSAIHLCFSSIAERALRADAQGYVIKQEATEKVLLALRRVLKPRNLRERDLPIACCNATSEARVRGGRRPNADLTIGTGSLSPHWGGSVRQELHISAKTVSPNQAQH